MNLTFQQIEDQINRIPENIPYSAQVRFYLDEYRLMENYNCGAGYTYICSDGYGKQMDLDLELGRVLLRAEMWLKVVLVGGIAR